MSDVSFTTTFAVDQTPEEAFAAINNVRGWWSGELDGRTDELGAEFTYRYKDIHRSTQKITELIAGKRVAWHVLYINGSLQDFISTGQGQPNHKEQGNEQ